MNQSLSLLPPLRIKWLLANNEMQKKNQNNMVKKLNKLCIQIPLTLPILFLGLDPNLFFCILSPLYTSW